MLWGVVDSKAVPDFGPDGLTVEVGERFSSVSAEIVHDQMDGLGFPVGYRQAEHNLCELIASPVGGGKREVAPRFRLYRAEYIGRAVAFVLAVKADFPPRPRSAPAVTGVV